MQNKKAFSLIELSIVVLIIGLVVLVIVGGSKLVQLSNLSKARALTNSSPVSGIEDLAMWYESTSRNSFPAVLVDGNKVVTWNDINPQLINKNNVTQATTANQPTYIANAINGLPAVRFDATNDNQRLQLNGSSFSGNTVFTIFMVFKFSAINSNTSNLIDLNDLTVLSDHAFAINASNQIIATIWDPGSSSNVGVVTSSALGANQLVMLTTTYNPLSNQSQLYLNGALQASATAPFTGKYSNLSITIGNYYNQPRTFGGDFGELIVFNRGLSAFERDQVQNYLSKKWGIKLS